MQDKLEKIDVFIIIKFLLSPVHDNVFDVIKYALLLVDKHYFQSKN